MDDYIIAASGPSQERVSRFAALLSEKLESYAGKSHEQKEDHPRRYRVLTDKPDGIKPSLSIYIDADTRDLALETLKDPEPGQSLAQQIDRIVKQEKQHSGDARTRRQAAADIIIGSQENLHEASSGVLRYIIRTDPASAKQRLYQKERQKRIDEMIRQYEQSRATARKARVKRALWTGVIRATLAVKRFIDIAASLAALILLFPLFAIVALIIKLTDGGPVFYVQQRIGRQGKSFSFPKFRSMVLNADQMKDSLLKDADRQGDVTFKMKHDPRVTRIGRFIRRFSIDELPQLWCVLKGDMSLVGPRPPVPREVALYTQEDRRRLEVTPGLTGIWQVSGRADIEFKKQVELDVLYIESHGILLDILLLLKTVPAVFTGRGAY